MTRMSKGQRLLFTPCSISGLALGSQTRGGHPLGFKPLEGYPPWTLALNYLGNGVG